MKALTVLVTADGYIGSRWRQVSAAVVGRVIAMQGRIPAVDPETLLDGVDVVLHLAGLPPPQGRADPAEYDRINREWTEALGVACARRGTRLLFPSTGSIYGASNEALLSEDSALLAPQNVYATSKYDAERALQSLSSRGLRFSILRFGSVFGLSPRMNFDRAVNKFTLQAVQHAPVQIWQTARHQMRPYTHVSDCAAAMNFFIENDIFSGGVYNVVSENATMDAVLSALRTAVPDIVVETVLSHAMNSFSYGMDDTRLRALGFKPHGTLVAGIADMVDVLRREKTEDG
jgi:UDP-glucose 4-epimerase